MTGWGQALSFKRKSLEKEIKGKEKFKEGKSKNAQKMQK